MRIFQVKPDVDKYQYLLYDLPPERMNLAPEFNGQRLETEWKPPPVYSLHPTRPKPDIWAVGLGSGAFGLTTGALEILDMFAEMAGELLPLQHGDTTLTVVNILDPLNCFDEKNSKFIFLEYTKRNALIKPCIRSDRLTVSTLFKSAHNPYEIYCWEEHGEPESEFKACIEANKLTGLLFDEVLVSQRSCEDA